MIRRKLVPATLVAFSTAVFACGAPPEETASSTGEAASACVAAPASTFWTSAAPLAPSNPSAVWTPVASQAHVVEGCGVEWMAFAAINPTTGVVSDTVWVPVEWSACFAALTSVCYAASSNTAGAETGDNDKDPPKCPAPLPTGPRVCVPPSLVATIEGPLACTVPSASPPECVAGAVVPDAGIPFVQRGSGGGGGLGGPPPPPPKGPILLQ